MRQCYCGGRYASDGKCGNRDCPRKQLGEGEWHIALPKLQAMEHRGTLRVRYPDLSMSELERHVQQHRTHRSRNSTTSQRNGGWRSQEEIKAHGTGAWRGPGREYSNGTRGRTIEEDSHGRQHARRYDERTPVHLSAPKRSLPQQSPRRVWRSRTEEASARTLTAPAEQNSLAQKQPEHPRPEGASASSVGNPVKAKCGPDMYADEAESEAGSAASDSKFTVLDSDDSNASIFGLRSALHEREDFDELSELSSEDDDQRSLAERDQVSRWRTEHFLLDDRDFAYVYKTFEEAYSNAGRAVAMAWSMDRLLAEPEMI